MTLTIHKQVYIILPGRFDAMRNEHLLFARQGRKQRRVELEHVRRIRIGFLLRNGKLVRDHLGQQRKLETLFQLRFESSKSPSYGLRMCQAAAGR